jgi:hypothetical protein
VAFIGPKQRGVGSTADSGGRFDISVTGVEGSREEGKQRVVPLLEGEEEDMSLSRR